MSSMLHLSTSLSDMNTSVPYAPPLTLHYTFKHAQTERALAAAELVKPNCKEGDTILLNYSIKNSPFAPEIMANWMSMRKTGDTFEMEEKYNIPVRQMPRDWTFCVCDFGLPDFERYDAIARR